MEKEPWALGLKVYGKDVRPWSLTRGGGQILLDVGSVMEILMGF